MSAPHCNFCGKDGDTVKVLIAGPGNVFICNECVLLCVDILVDKSMRRVRSMPSIDAAIEEAEGKMSEQELTAKMLEKLFGYCEDEDFEADCVGCLASHLIRTLRQQPTENADVILQGLVKKEGE